VPQEKVLEHRLMRIGMHGQVLDAAVGELDQAVGVDR
jgi:hypothetical protein